MLASYLGVQTRRAVCGSVLQERLGRACWGETAELQRAARTVPYTVNQRSCCPWTGTVTRKHKRSVASRHRRWPGLRCGPHLPAGARRQLLPGAARGHCYVPGGQARSPMQLSPSWAGAATAMSLLIPPPPSSGLPSSLLKHWVGLQLRRLAASSHPGVTGRTTSTRRSPSGSLLPAGQRAPGWACALLSEGDGERNRPGCWVLSTLSEPVTTAVGPSGTWGLQHAGL